MQMHYLNLKKTTLKVKLKILIHSVMKENFYTS